MKSDTCISWEGGEPFIPIIPQGLSVLGSSSSGSWAVHGLFLRKCSGRTCRAARSPQDHVHLLCEHLVGALHTPMHTLQLVTRSLCGFAGHRVFSVAPRIQRHKILLHTTENFSGRGWPKCWFFQAFFPDNSEILLAAFPAVMSGAGTQWWSNDSASRRNESCILLP